VPHIITVDKNSAYPAAINDLQYMGNLPKACKLRQIKYLNNRIESDHRFIKRQCRHKQWFKNYCFRFYNTNFNFIATPAGRKIAVWLPAFRTFLRG
jgi:transposase-like protein